ncbi:MAG: guanylate kinase [Alphaproteobacteria bacterium]|nr:guanylate kinase [Alphaproteobacteria bacterium]
MTLPPSPDRRGLLLVVSSPSGAGKTSLCKRLTGEFSELGLSISCTTRAPRPGEEDGREYNFIDRADFEARVARGEFLEWAEVHENLYGTPKAAVMERLARGQDVLFDIDWQGAAQIRAAAPDDMVGVFILPPTLAALERRLHTRAQDSHEVITRRLARARGEIERWPDYDYVIINDEFDAAYERLARLYQAERDRRVRNPWIAAFVSGLFAQSP